MCDVKGGRGLGGGEMLNMLDHTHAFAGSGDWASTATPKGAVHCSMALDACRLRRLHLLGPLLHCTALHHTEPPPPPPRKTLSWLTYLANLGMSSGSWRR